MNIELIRREIAELLNMVEGWNTCDGVADIERDIALDKIKQLYEQLRFSTFTTPIPTQHTDDEEEEDSNELEVEVELTYYEGEEEEIEVEASEEQIEESDIEEEEEEEEEEEPLIPFELVDISIIPENEEVANEEVAKDEEQRGEQQREETTTITPTENALFDITTIPIRQKSRRSAILSLYSDDEPTAPSVASTPQPQSTPAAIEIEEEEEEIKIEEITRDIVEESSNAESTFVTTIADRYAEQMPSSNIASTNAPSSINDRYIISQELFGGDMQACEEMFEALEEIDNFDDGMIYIIENYDWNPDCEATKIVVKLLEQRFLS